MCEISTVKIHEKIKVIFFLNFFWGFKLHQLGQRRAEFDSLGGWVGLCFLFFQDMSSDNLFLRNF